MFERRELGGELATVRERHAPGAIVLDSARDFETLDPAVAESLGPMADGLAPVTYDEAWLPADAPDELRRFAGETFVIGMPGDGGVAWTRQTVPPTVIVKPRLDGAGVAFVDFLLAEALVEVGLDVPEQFLGFFREQYGSLADAVPFGPADTYQLAVALYDAYVGLHTREIFAEWADDTPGLHRAWVDAGDNLRGRLDELPRAVATGSTPVAAAAELAGNAVKHGLPLPPPFAALDTAAFREHGASFAVRWAERTGESLDRRSTEGA